MCMVLQCYMCARECDLERCTHIRAQENQKRFGSATLHDLRFGFGFGACGLQRHNHIAL